MAFEKPDANGSGAAGAIAQNPLGEPPSNANSLIPPASQADRLTDESDPVITTPQDDTESFAEQTIEPVFDLAQLFFIVFGIIALVIVSAILIHGLYSIKYILFNKPPLEDTGNADEGDATASPAEKGSE